MQTHDPGLRVMRSKFTTNAILLGDAIGKNNIKADDFQMRKSKSLPLDAAMFENKHAMQCTTKNFLRCSHVWFDKDFNGDGMSRSPRDYESEHFVIE